MRKRSRAKNTRTGEYSGRAVFTVEERTHPLRKTYEQMLCRCYVKSNPRYHRYGGRGIRVTQEWQGVGGFTRWVAHMGERPLGYTMDRIDNDGNYEPNNTRWASKETQNENKTQCNGLRTREREKQAAALDNCFL